MFSLLVNIIFGCKKEQNLTFCRIRFLRMRPFEAQKKKTKNVSVFFISLLSSLLVLFGNLVGPNEQSRVLRHQIRKIPDSFDKIREVEVQ